MVKIWRNRVWAGTQNLSSCPAKYKPGVIELMAQDIEDGTHTKDALRQLVEAGNVSEADYKLITGEDYDA